MNSAQRLPPRLVAHAGELVDVTALRLPDIIAPGLAVLFVGFNPSVYAALRGHYYARPGNRFYHLLHRAGLDPWALPDPGRAVPGRPLWVEPPSLLDNLHHPGRPQQDLGVRHGMQQ